MTTDTIYSAEQTVTDFVFDEAVATVFADMINRSVPGYASTISTIGELATTVVTENSKCYDLGCSLGAATIAMRHGIRRDGCEIIAVDLSKPMLHRCEENIAVDSAATPVTIIEADICDIEISNASLVVLNFTLQFVPVAKREKLLKTIFHGLKPGGVLLISEKIRFADEKIQTLNTTLHHRFKAANGYSELEISQKRAALENTLIPETLDEHRQRLDRAGFSSHHTWYQCFSFMSMLAIK